jgi:hypothetical protein
MLNEPCPDQMKKQYREERSAFFILDFIELNLYYSVFAMLQVATDQCNILM